MKGVISFWLFLFGSMLLSACRDNRPPEIMYASELDTIEYPVLIDGGKRIVYKVGQMTPRGLKYYLDTTDVNNSKILLPDSAESDQ
jgi:hypothetical protein